MNAGLRVIKRRQFNTSYNQHLIEFNKCTYKSLYKLSILSHKYTYSHTHIYIYINIQLYHDPLKITSHPWNEKKNIGFVGIWNVIWNETRNRETVFTTRTYIIEFHFRCYWFCVGCTKQHDE